MLEATVHPRAVHAVVRLLEVEESEAPLEAVARGRLLKPVHLPEVEEHVVCDVAARDKGHLGDRMSLASLPMRSARMLAMSL